MAREPVAIDFIGLGERGHVVGLMGSTSHGSPIDDERVSRVATGLVRPVPSVPEFHHLANRQAMSRLLPVSEGFRIWTDTRGDNAGTSSLFARPGAAGTCRPPWVNKHAMAMRQLQDQSFALTAEVSEGHSVGQSPSRAAWDLHSSAPASPTHHTMSSSNRFQVFAQQLAQQARKATSMYADPQQASRNNALVRTSPIGDEAHASLSGAEPSSVSHPHPSSSNQSAGFGSPVPLPLYSRLKPGNTGVENGIIPQQQHHQQAVQEVNMTAAHALVRPATGKQPQTAQLTIFYAGMVNVYDEIPADKAQAIMLLAGKGSTWSSNYANVPGSSCVPASGRPIATALSAVSQPPSRAGSPAPQVTTSTSIGAPPPGPVPSISNRPTPTTTTVELPQARKASLARFLERRKDRVRKGPYIHRNTELAAREAIMRLNRENSPSPSSSSRPPRRSLSPPGAGNQNNIPFNATRAANGQAGASTSGTASEPSSPNLPTPRKQRSNSQERPNGVILGGSLDINPVASPSRGKAAAGAVETEHSS